MLKSVLTNLLVLTVMSGSVGAQDAPDIRANVSEVTDNRTTGEFFAGLNIELSLMGSEVQDAKAYRFIVEKGVDDLGTDLVKEEAEPELQEISRFGNTGGPVSISVDLKNPPRQARYVKQLSGTLELFAPKKDPDSLAWIQNAQELMGSPLESPKLKKAGVDILLLTKEQYEEKKKEQESKVAEDVGGKVGEAFAEAFGAMFGGFGMMGENSIIMKISDPKDRIIAIEFINRGGEEIETTSRMTMGEISAYDFYQPLPETYGIRVLLATEKALIRVPVTVKDIALP